VLPPAWREHLEHVGVDRMHFLLQLLELTRHPLHVLQDHHVRDEVVVLDDPALLVLDILHVDAFAAEHQSCSKCGAEMQPLGEELISEPM
jgi:hypothetical protein